MESEFFSYVKVYYCVGTAMKLYYVIVRKQRAPWRWTDEHATHLWQNIKPCNLSWRLKPNYTNIGIALNMKSETFYFWDIFVCSEAFCTLFEQQASQFTIYMLPLKEVSNKRWYIAKFYAYFLVQI